MISMLLLYIQRLHWSIAFFFFLPWDVTPSVLRIRLVQILSEFVTISARSRARIVWFCGLFAPLASIVAIVTGAWSIRARMSPPIDKRQCLIIFEHIWLYIYNSKFLHYGLTKLYVPEEIEASMLHSSIDFKKRAIRTGRGSASLTGQSWCLGQVRAIACGIQFSAQAGWYAFQPERTYSYV